MALSLEKQQIIARIALRGIELILPSLKISQDQYKIEEFLRRFVGNDVKISHAVEKALRIVDIGNTIVPCQPLLNKITVEKSSRQNYIFPAGMLCAQKQKLFPVLKDSGIADIKTIETHLNFLKSTYQTNTERHINC